MRVTCSQEDLAPILQTLSTVTRNETLPLYHSAQISATRPEENSEQGTLHVVGLGLFGMVGGSIQIPATVEQPGQTRVPLEPLAAYVSVLRPGSLLLHQENTQEEHAEAFVEPEAPTDPGPPTLIAPEEPTDLGPPTLIAPLHIESTTTSTKGKRSTHHARFATFEQDSPSPLPPIQGWLATGERVAMLQAAVLKAALSRCIALANEGTSVKNQATEMYGVLVQCDVDALEFCATQGTTLLSHRLRLSHSASGGWTGLFSGEALSWIREALSGDEGEVSIILAEEILTHQPALLVSTARMTWFCRSMQAPFPRSWTHTLHLPHTEELEVRRKELARPLAFFTNANVQTCELETTGTTLWIRPCADKADAVQGAWEIPGARASSDLHLLVHCQQFKQCMHAAQGDVLRLQVGQLERQEGFVRKQAGFVRIVVSEQTTVMMSLSRREVVPLSPPPILSSSDRPELAERGME